MPHNLTAYEVTYIISVNAHNMDEAEEKAKEAIETTAPDIVEVVPDEEEECDDDECEAAFDWLVPEWGD